MIKERKLSEILKKSIYMQGGKTFGNNHNKSGDLNV